MAEVPYQGETRRRTASKKILWVASAKKDLKAIPEEVQDDIGYALDLDRISDRLKQAREHHAQQKG